MKTKLYLVLLPVFLLSGCVTCPFYPSPKGVKIAETAKKWVGKSYKPGQTRQCANFVAHVVKQAGESPPPSAAMARSWLKWGKPVPFDAAKPGDVVVLWRGSPRGRAGHILVIVGPGEAVHRSTYRSPVKKVDIAAYRGKILGVRRAV